MVPLQLLSHPSAGAQKEFSLTWAPRQQLEHQERGQKETGTGHKVSRVNTTSLLTSNNSPSPPFFFVKWGYIYKRQFPWY